MRAAALVLWAVLPRVLRLGVVLGHVRRRLVVLVQHRTLGRLHAWLGAGRSVGRKHGGRSRGGSALSVLVVPRLFGRIGSRRGIRNLRWQAVEAGLLLLVLLVASSVELRGISISVGSDHQIATRVVSEQP